MYVLTNYTGVNEASALLYPKVLEEFYHKYNCDFYVLPSSIHEVILLPSSDAVNPKLLRSMVQEVNQTIAEEERLSSHVYRFGKEHELELIA